VSASLWLANACQRSAPAADGRDVLAGHGAGRTLPPVLACHHNAGGVGAGEGFRQSLGAETFQSAPQAIDDAINKLLTVRVRVPLIIGLVALQAGIQIDAAAHASPGQATAAYEACFRDKTANHSLVKQHSTIGISFIAPSGYAVTKNTTDALVLEPYQEACMQSLRASYPSTRLPLASWKGFDADPGSLAILRDWSAYHLEGTPDSTMGTDGTVDILGQSSIVYQSRGGRHLVVKDPHGDSNLLVITALVNDQESLLFIRSLGAP
jgi:hypothetical protein